MPRIGKYCKAYPVKGFREFSGWTEDVHNLRKANEQREEKEIDVGMDLTDTDFLYLQENFTVTDGIFLDENVIFDKVTPEWTSFCQGALEFEPPVYESASGDAEESA